MAREAATMPRYGQRSTTFAAENGKACRASCHAAGKWLGTRADLTPHRQLFSSHTPGSAMTCAPRGSCRAARTGPGRPRIT
eukprot:11728698-Alexandrium_andersonii.AAC.1